MPVQPTPTQQDSAAKLRLKMKPQRIGDIKESFKRGFIKVVWSQDIEDTEVAERLAREKEQARIAELDRITNILDEVAAFDLNLD